MGNYRRPNQCVDANNAFNSLNREVALRNIQHLCPSLSVVLINTDREDIDLFVDVQHCFQLKEPLKLTH